MSRSSNSSDESYIDEDSSGVSDVEEEEDVEDCFLCKCPLGCFTISSSIFSKDELLSIAHALAEFSAEEKRGWLIGMYLAPPSLLILRVVFWIYGAKGTAATRPNFDTNIT